MTNGADTITRWADRMQGQTHLKELRASNVFAEDDRLFSYGHHFELARALRDRKGKVHAYLLNGERYSNTTAKHQSWVRNVLGRTGVPMAIIPHAALSEAGVDMDTVQIVDVLPDRWEMKRHHTRTWPTESAHYRMEDVYENQPPTEQDYANAVAQATVEARQSWEYYVKWHAEDPRLWRDPGPFVPPTRDDVRVYSKRVLVGQVEKLYTSARSNTEITVTYGADGPVYDWVTNTHYLGESLVRARVTWLRRNTCRWCEGTGRGIGAEDATRWHENPTCQDCRGRGTVVTEHHRWAYFLSGFDHQESTPLYFFCELPYRSKPKTVAEAYEMLKPDPVKMAEQMGRRVSRQGDIFAIPTRLETKALKAMGARIVRRRKPPERWKAQDLPYILKTNHTATEVAYLPNGVTMARGVLYHHPMDREQDHARRKMGDGSAWHIVIKNTVPTAGRR